MAGMRPGRDECGLTAKGWAQMSDAAPGWLALEFLLQSRSPETVARQHADQVYAAALDLLDRDRPGQGHEAHEAPRDKGFCASWLTTPQGRPLATEEPFGPDEPVVWRLTGLTPELCAAWRRLAADPPAVVRLGRAHCMVLGVRLAAEVDAAVCLADWRRASSAELPNAVVLSLQTPTAFRVRDTEGRNRVAAWPAPRLVFGGLERRWERLIGLPLPTSQVPLDDLSITLGDWSGQTAVAHCQERPFSGAVGRFTLGLPADVEARRRAALLLSFAGHAGVGWRVAHGFGRVALAPA